MNKAEISKIIHDVNYVRTGGSPEELRAAEYFKERCEEMGVSAYIEDFPVQMAKINDVHMYADGKEIPCTAFKNCGSGSVEAPLIYLPFLDEVGLSKVEGKIVMVDSGLTHWVLYDLLDHGAVGIITYNGNMNYRDRDINQKELRDYVAQGRKVLAVNMNVKDAFELIKSEPKMVKIVIDQDEWMGNSRNVVAELPGLCDEWIVVSAHYDSVPESIGTYDNLTGTIGVLGILDILRKNAPMHYGVRFLFCGSEERGLLGAKAHLALHESEIEKIIFDINMDMIGAMMGTFVACCTASDSLVNYIHYYAMEKGISLKAYAGVYSSDSTPFADKGIPAMSFGSWCSNEVAPIHNRYDTPKVVSVKRLQDDIAFIAEFAKRMASASVCPVPREIPEKLRLEVDYYTLKKRKPKA